MGDGAVPAPVDETSDLGRALAIVRFLAPGSATVRFLVVEGLPRAKARPRFRRDGRAYASPEQAAAEAALGWAFRREFPEPLAGNLAVGCIFFRPDRQRIDVDNMLKHVMDSANAIAWHDDAQVTAQLGIVELDRERPRTVVVIAEHGSTMVRRHPARDRAR